MKDYMYIAGFFTVMFFGFILNVIMYFHFIH